MATTVISNTTETAVGAVKGSPTGSPVARGPPTDSAAAELPTDSSAAMISAPSNVAGSSTGSSTSQQSTSGLSTSVASFSMGPPASQVVRVHVTLGNFIPKDCREVLPVVDIPIGDFFEKDGKLKSTWFQDSVLVTIFVAIEDFFKAWGIPTDPLMDEIWFPFSKENDEDDRQYAFRKLVEITGTDDEYKSIQRLYRLRDALTRFRASDTMIFEWDLGFARRLVSPLRDAVFGCPALVNQFNLLRLSGSSTPTQLVADMSRALDKQLDDLNSARDDDDDSSEVSPTELFADDRSEGTLPKEPPKVRHVASLKPSKHPITSIKQRPSTAAKTDISSLGDGRSKTGESSNDRRQLSPHSSPDSGSRASRSSALRSASRDSPSAAASSPRRNANGASTIKSSTKNRAQSEPEGHRFVSAASSGGNGGGYGGGGNGGGDDDYNSDGDSDGDDDASRDSDDDHDNRRSDRRERRSRSSRNNVRFFSNHSRGRHPPRYEDLAESRKEPKIEQGLDWKMHTFPVGRVETHPITGLPPAWQCLPTGCYESHRVLPSRRPPRTYRSQAFHVAPSPLHVHAYG